ncbi:putative ATP-grasp-modified RiPP [Micromonospora sp. WMMA1363]|nr:putative ATP-grasp-modified RiPP [Micromonospora sp. WMMA1363]MDM4718438.1 putative ATP-grasp-modified RiPP [Micromonospora sp. WMMA1363]MDM4721858.1 putative ATP-grasp-modified RiPP [Micromonospora sp. WMMA1363]
MTASGVLTPPLVSESERFATGQPPGQTPSDSVPSAQGIRPFGLRFATPLDSASPALPEWRWCPERQIGVTPDGEPWHRTIAAGTKATTGQSTDGGPSTGGEEWTPDFMPDQSS